jgi:hypothetical protein
MIARSHHVLLLATISVLILGHLTPTRGQPCGGAPPPLFNAGSITAIVVQPGSVSGACAPTFRLQVFYNPFTLNPTGCTLPLSPLVEALVVDPGSNAVIAVLGHITNAAGGSSPPYCASPWTTTFVPPPGPPASGATSYIIQMVMRASCAGGAFPAPVVAACPYSPTPGTCIYPPLPPGGANSLTITGTALPGLPGHVTVVGTPPSAAGFLVVSPGTASLSALGGTILVNLPTAIFVCPVIACPVTASAAGVYDLTFAVPNPPIGVVLYAQAAFANPAAPAGFSLTNGLSMNL